MGQQTSNVTEMVCHRKDRHGGPGDQAAFESGNVTEMFGAALLWRVGDENIRLAHTQGRTCSDPAFSKAEVRGSNPGVSESTLRGLNY